LAYPFQLNLANKQPRDHIFQCHGKLMRGLIGLNFVQFPDMSIYYLERLKPLFHEISLHYFIEIHSLTSEVSFDFLVINEVSFEIESRLSGMISSS